MGKHALHLMTDVFKVYGKRSKILKSRAIPLNFVQLMDVLSPVSQTNNSLCERINFMICVWPGAQTSVAYRRVAANVIFPQAVK